MKAKIEFINPDELLKNPAFSQIAVTKGSGTTIYIGGQNAITKDLEIIGKGDIALQTEHILKNIETALKACDATLDDLFKLTIYIVQGQDVRKGFEEDKIIILDPEKDRLCRVRTYERDLKALKIF